MKTSSFRAALRGGALLLLLPLFSTAARGLQVPGPLVETGWLADNLEQVVVLDVRKDAGSYTGAPLPAGKALDLKKLTGHIPGAVSVPWKGIVTKGREGRINLKGMLPPPKRFAELMRKSGVDNDSAVVIAGRGAVAKDQAFATRLYFTLKYYGHDNLALLNGGTAQWAKEGRPRAYDRVIPEPGDFSVREGRAELLASTAEVEQAVERGDVQLLDCRPEDFFHGLTHKGKFVPASHKGHLPGAKSLPHLMLANNVGPARLYRGEAIRKVTALKGVDPLAPTITYCNTGVEASLPWFVLHELYENPQVRLYDGSMHAWSSVDPAHAVQSLAMVMEQEPAHEEEVKVAAASEPQSVPAYSPVATLADRRFSIERRREQLRRERRHHIDAVTGRYLLRPPWVNARRQLLDAYREQRRELQRQRREKLRAYREERRAEHFSYGELLHGDPLAYAW